LGEQRRHIYRVPHFGAGKSSQFTQQQQVLIINIKFKLLVRDVLVLVLVLVLRRRILSTRWMILICVQNHLIKFVF
jgi:hypothetical protein